MGWFQYDNGLRHERVKVLIHRLLLHWKYYILKDLLLFWKKQRAPDKNKFEKNFACIFKKIATCLKIHTDTIWWNADFIKFDLDLIWQNLDIPNVFPILFFISKATKARHQ